MRNKIKSIQYLLITNVSSEGTYKKFLEFLSENPSCIIKNREFCVENDSIIIPQIYSNYEELSLALDELAIAFGSMYLVGENSVIKYYVNE